MQVVIKEVARVLQNNPRLKKVSQQKRESLVEFVMGNMLFVLLHELGHATVQELRIPSGLRVNKWPSCHQRFFRSKPGHN